MIANIISPPREDAKVGSPRRFSEGMERVPTAPSTVRVGRFSDGMAPSLGPVHALGSFADGLAHTPAPRHVGSFADSYGPVKDRRPARPRRAPAPEPAQA